MRKILAIAALATMIGQSASAGAKEMGPLKVTMTGQAEAIFNSTMEDAGIKDQGRLDEVMCLAQNIYFEARAESISGKAGVANVTKNRVEDSRWPDTYCGVVGDGPTRESWKTKQHADLPDSERVYYPRKHRCQFSWYCDGIKDVIWANKIKTGQTIEANARAWQDSVNVAIWTTGYSDIKITDNTKGAVFYYAHHLVYPTWADEKTYIGVLGNHTFMK
jgi:spore germination cell wall hydrolase CwlJ-like protein